MKRTNNAGEFEHKKYQHLKTTISADSKLTNQNIYLYLDHNIMLKYENQE